MFTLYPNGAAPNGYGGAAATSTPPVTLPDTTLPAMVGSITLSAITTTGAHAAWQAGTDNIGVAGYEVSCDTGVPAWLDVGNVLFADLLALVASTDYTVRVRDYDEAGNYSTPITAPLRTADEASPDPDPSTGPLIATVRFIPLTPLGLKRRL